MKYGELMNNSKKQREQQTLDSRSGENRYQYGNLMRNKYAEDNGETVESRLQKEADRVLNPTDDDDVSLGSSRIRKLLNTYGQGMDQNYVNGLNALRKSAKSPQIDPNVQKYSQMSSDEIRKEWKKKLDETPILMGGPLAPNETIQDREAKQFEQDNNILAFKTDDGKEYTYADLYATARDRENNELIKANGLDKLYSQNSNRAEVEKAFADNGADLGRYETYLKREKRKDRYDNIVSKAYDWASDNPGAATKGNTILSIVPRALEGLASVGYGIVDSFTNSSGLSDADSYRKADTSWMLATGISDAMNQGVTDQISSELGKAIYSGVTSGVQSYGTAILANALMPGYGALITQLVMSSSAAGSSFKNSIENGKSTQSALALALANGINEAITEKFSVEAFLNIADSGKVLNFKETVVNILKQTFAEGSEEVSSDVLNAIADSIINGDISEYNTNVKSYTDQGYSESDAKKFATKDFLTDAMYSFIGGAAGGFVGGVSAVAINDYRYAEAGKQIDKEELDKVASEVGSERVRKVGNTNTAIGRGKVATQLVQESYEGLQKSQAETSAKVFTDNEAKIKNIIKGTLNIRDAETINMVYGLAKKTVSGEKLTRSEQNVYDSFDMTNLFKQIDASPTIRNSYSQLRTENVGKALEKISKVSEVVNPVKEDNVSKVGKTTLVSDPNKEIKVQGFSGDTTQLKLADGTSVEFDEVRFGSNEEATLCNRIKALNMDSSVANAIVDAYNTKTSEIKPSEFVRVANLAIDYGRYGLDTSESESLSRLSEKDRNVLVNIGKHFNEMSGEVARAKAEKVRLKKSGAVNNKGAVLIKGQKVSAKEIDSMPLTERQKVSVKALSAFTEAVTHNVIDFYESKPVKNGKSTTYVIEDQALAKELGILENKTEDGKYYIAPNGATASNGIMYIDLNAGALGQGTILYTAAHEYTHFIAENAPEQYKAISDFVAKEYLKAGRNKADYIAVKKESYQQSGRNLSDEAAWEEIVADSMETMFADSDAMMKAQKYMDSLSAEQKNVFKKAWENLKKALQKLLDSIRNLYKTSSATEYGEFVRDLESGVKDALANLYAEGLVEAGSNYAEMTPESGSIAYSIKEKDNIEKRSMEFFARNSDGISKHISSDMLDAANGIINKMADYMSPFLDLNNTNGKRYLPEEILGKTTFANGSYGRTIENTTICFRTLAYIDFTNEIKRKIGRPLTVEESFLASQMLYEIAKEPQCLYCYVSLDRKAYDGFLLEYTKQRDDAMSKYREADIDPSERLKPQAKKKSARSNPKYALGDSALENIYKEYLDGRDDTPDQRNRFNLWVEVENSNDRFVSNADLTTEELRSELKNNQGLIANQIIDAEKYAQGASWAKKMEQYRSYNSDILTMSPETVKKLNQHYGLRFYSFSEYTPAFIVENMQQIRDAALKGLYGLAYTKKTDFARIFAPTNMNINISVFGKMIDGNVVADTRQGADWAEVQELRKQYKNVGAVFVATSDELTRWALNQDWIDVVIPFHIVRTGANVAEFYKWTNNTKFQADVNEKGRNKTITPAEHHNDRATFDRLIKERGLTPRFAQFLDDPNYMKLVNETRLSDKESSKLVPNFTEDTYRAAVKSFDTFVNDGGYYDGWYKEDADYGKAVNAVSEDILAGKKANEVDYGRQDINIDEEKKRIDRYKKSPSMKEHGQKLQNRDSEYLELAKNPQKNEARLRELVETEAKKNGYDSPLLFHGTTRGFGFTEIDFSKSDDGVSFFMTDSIETASTYSSIKEIREVTHDFDPEVMSNKAYKKYTDSISSVGTYVNGLSGIRGFVDFALLLRQTNRVLEDVENGVYTEDDEIRMAVEEIADDLAYGLFSQTEEEFNNDFDEYQGTDEYGKIIDGFAEVASNLIAYVKTLTNLDEIGNYQLYANTDGFMNVDCEGRLWRNIGYEYNGKTYNTTRNITELAKSLGYKGVIFKNIVDNGDYGSAKASNVYVAFESSQVKSADLVTYDGNGDVIPLSERFNSENEDIRYQIRVDGASEEDTEIVNKAKQRSYYGGKALFLTEDRYEALVRAMTSSNQDYAKAYIAWMKPNDFLDATTPSAEVQQRIRDDAGTLDQERLSNYDENIYLWTDLEDSSIIGHEGRHRMSALAKDGIENVAVVIKTSEGDKYKTKPISIQKFTGQRFPNGKGRDIYIHQLIPVSTRYKDAVKEIFTESGRGFSISQKYEGSIKYQIRDSKGNERIAMGTYFSGGGLVDYALSAMADTIFGVEWNDNIRKWFKTNNGSELIETGKDVRDFEKGKYKGTLDYLHGSPVCKNFSKAKVDAEETPLDIETAKALAEEIRASKPRFVTVENVKQYKKSEAIKLIEKALKDEGYDYRIDTLKASDYGNATTRERMFIRAVRDGKVPELKPETPYRGGWFAKVEDLIDGLDATNASEYTVRKASEKGYDVNNLKEPLLVDGRGNVATASALAPTVTTKLGGSKIYMPDGRVLDASPRVFARLQGLDDKFELPEEKGLAYTIIGNGVPVELMQAVAEPMLQMMLDENPNLTKYQYRDSESWGNGYDGYSMSNNARTAYEEGQKPISKWSKTDIISAVAELDTAKAEMLKRVNLKTLKDKVLTNVGWHHTSEYYNKTDFYAVTEDRVKSITESDIKKWATSKETMSTGREFRGDIEYLEWSGSRQHPKATEKKLTDVNIEERGSYYIVTDDDGNEILRKKIGSNGTKVTDYELEARVKANMERIKAQRDSEVMSNSSDEAYRMYKSGEFTESSSSGNLYRSGRKPTRYDVANGLENFFEVGEQRLTPNANNGYEVQTWNGSGWDAEPIETRYQQRTETLDTRSLLANALESTVQNDIEFKNLEEYKSKISELNEMQSELADIRSEIYEMSFTKGERDTVKLNALKEEANKLANRINIADKKLLRLESTKALKNVVEREKTLAEQRARKRFNETLQSANERKEMTVIRRKIRKIADELSDRITKGNDKKYVPQNLVKSVITAIDAIDYTSKDQDAKTTQKFLTARQALSEIGLRYRELAAKDAAKGVAQESPFSVEFDEEFSAKIDALTKVVDDTPLRDIKDINVLSDIYDIISDIKYMVVSANRFLNREEAISVNEGGNHDITLFDTLKAKGIANKNKANEFFRNEMTNPLRIVAEISGYDTTSELWKLFNEINEGRRASDYFQMVETKKFDELRKTKEEKKFFEDSVTKKIDFGIKDENGKPTMMTKQQAFQLLLTWEREQANPNRAHMSKSGTKIPDAELMAKGKFTEAIDNATYLHTVTEEDIEAIKKSLTEWDKRYLDAARTFFNKASKEAINSVTMQTKHRLVAEEKAYIPYEIDNNYVKKESENVAFNASIEERGNLKSVVANASQPLVMRGLNVVLSRQIKSVGEIYGLTIPIRNYKKFINMQQTDEQGGMTLKRALTDAWGDKVLEVIDQAVADLQGTLPTQNSKLMAMIKQSFVTSTLAFNISVAMKQAASYPTAGSVLSAKSLVEGLGRFITRKSSEIYDEIDEHTSQHYIRRKGLSLQELGDMRQGKGWQNVLSDKMGNWSPMNWIQAIDVGTTAALWEACKVEVENKGTGPDDKMYFEKVTKLYNQVIEETQPMYDTLHRSKVTKYRDGLGNIIMFQTQPLQNSGILRESSMKMADAKKRYGADSKQFADAKKKYIKAVTSQLASHLTFTLMTFAAGAFLHRLDPWKDDDKELTVKSVLGEMTLEFLRSVVGAAVPVIGSYTWDAIGLLTGKNRYDVLSDSIVQKVNDTLQAFSRLKNPTFENFRKCAFDVLTYLGVPAENAYKFIDGIIQNARSIFTGEYETE